MRDAQTLHQDAAKTSTSVGSDPTHFGQVRPKMYSWSRSRPQYAFRVKCWPRPEIRKCKLKCRAQCIQAITRGGQPCQS